MAIFIPRGWREVGVLVIAGIALSTAIIFAFVQLDSAPPATSDDTQEVLDEVTMVLIQVQEGQELTNCRAQVNNRFDAAFAVVAMLELNGGEYPETLGTTVIAQLPPPDEARRTLARAALDKARLATTDNPAGTDVICPISD